MAVLRDLPYGRQHFQVDLGTGNVNGPDAGFSEVILPDISVDVVEYRTGNAKETGVHKLPGMARYSNVTLRRGIIGSLSLYNWIDDVRNGDANAQRTVTIQLLSEDRTTVVVTWKAMRAWPTRYSFGELNAKSNEVAIEELVLACERVEME